jgi:hypothetical protein
LAQDLRVGIGTIPVRGISGIGFMSRVLSEFFSQNARLGLDAGCGSVTVSEQFQAET